MKNESACLLCMSTATAHHVRNENMQDSFFFRCQSFDFYESTWDRMAEQSIQWSKNVGMQSFIFWCTLHCKVLKHFLSSCRLNSKMRRYDGIPLVPDPRSIENREDRGFQVPSEFHCRLCSAVCCSHTEYRSSCESQQRILCPLSVRVSYEIRVSVSDPPVLTSRGHVWLDF